MSVPIRILEGPAEGYYRSIAVLYRSLSPSLPYRRFYDRLQRLAGPGSAALTASDLAALCCPQRGKPDHLPAHPAARARNPQPSTVSTNPVIATIRVLDGPLAGHYLWPASLHKALGPAAQCGLQTLKERLRIQRRVARTPSPHLLVITSADVAALNKPGNSYVWINGRRYSVSSAVRLVPPGFGNTLVRLVRSGQRVFESPQAMVEACAVKVTRVPVEINVLDGPAAGRYPTVSALLRRLANDGPIAAVTVRHRFERLRRKKGLATASLELSGEELAALIAGDRPLRGGHLAVPLRVLDGPHAGSYRSARALFEQAGSAEMSITYNYFLDRLKRLDSRTARPDQRPRQITGAQLVALLARRQVNPRQLHAAATDLLAGNPSATAVELQQEILRRYGLSIGEDRARSALGQLAAGDEVGGARSAPPLFTRSPWALATRVTDGPYAGNYRSLDELRAALAVDREICPSNFMRRMKAYRLARYGTDNHPAVISHADLLNLLHSTTEARGRRPVPLRITSGPYAGDYRSTIALYRALEPACLVRSACFLNRFRNLCSADATPARVPIELSGGALSSLIQPKFLTDERLLSVCSAALIRDPGVTVSALTRELQLVLAKPISTDRIAQALEEARRLPQSTTARTSESTDGGFHEAHGAAVDEPMASLGLAWLPWQADFAPRDIDPTSHPAERLGYPIA
jgi:hypothetical protein